MSLMVIFYIFLAIFIVSMIYEPRNFWNAFLFLATLGFFAIGISAKPGIAGKILGVILMLIPVIFVVAAIFLIINGFVMMKKEGHRLHNLLSLLMGVAMIGGGVFTICGMYYFQDSKVLRTMLTLIICLEFYIAFAFVALLIYSLIYTYLPKRVKCDYIIVHGCGLIDGERISPLLKGRVDKAVRVYKKCKNHPKIVVSGGKGSDEKISEAEAMKNYLNEIGFLDEEIIMEDKSKTTFENLKNVRDMLDTDGKKNNYIFVTNNYHVFRASLYTKKLKMKAEGVGCKTALYYWPSAFIREFIALMVKYKWIFFAIILLWCIVVAMVNLR